MVVFRVHTTAEGAFLGDDGWYTVTLPTTGAWADGFPYYGVKARTVRCARVAFCTMS